MALGSRGHQSQGIEAWDLPEEEPSLLQAPGGWLVLLLCSGFFCKGGISLQVLGLVKAVVSLSVWAALSLPLIQAITGGKTWVSVCGSALHKPPPFKALFFRTETNVHF